MVLVDPIQDTNHCTANQCKSSGFSVFTQDRADRLLYLSELVSARSDQTAIKQIPAYTVPYLVYSDSYTTEDPSEVSEPLLAGRISGRKEKPESDFS